MADRLRDYRGKRDLAKTAEPAGAGAEGSDDGLPRFVVQEHDARRLHWDLRLEHEGVLASWALPRFLPSAPGDDRLAVRTEDHPLEYLTFEGEIPAGEYGAGTIRVFDAGDFEVLKWEPRKIEVALRGERVRGRYALFALARAGERAGRDWMIHRMDPPEDPDVMPAPEVLEPMLATPGPLPDGPAWAFEVKWDGIRALCRSEPGHLVLRGRHGADITARYPELQRLNRDLHEHAAVLDGEIVALDARGRPSFAALQRRMHVERPAAVRRLAREQPVTYVVFDLLWLDGRSLLELPYDERRERLRALGLQGERWQVPEAHLGDGRELLAVAERLGLEGVVAKRRDGRYQPGRRSRAWVKVTRRETLELRIGGWLEGRGARRGHIGSLLVGEPEPDGGLRYAGRVGSGLSAREAAELEAALAPLARERSPFTAGGARPPRGAHWVEPVLVGQVACRERSERGVLRHPVWRGRREPQADPRLVLEDERRVRGRGLTATAVVEGRAIALTNLDKVLYPAAGTTKREVLEYYARIAPVMVPHLRGRPLTLRRFPDGVDGEAFYEKRAPEHRPDWVATAEVGSGAGAVRQVRAEDGATLVWLAQLAALELHPGLALAAAPDVPLVVVFDLDPGAPATIVECCRVALLVRGMLAGIGLQAFPKTSGSKGLQLYVPLGTGEADFAATKRFARAVARVLEGEEPDLVVARQAKAARRGRVLIDWQQNDRARSTVAAYSLRARERPTVSAPLAWEEVEACAASGDPRRLDFTASEVLARVGGDGDLFGSVLAVRQRLPAG